MKTYLVGGAVRDSMLGVQSSDRDYLVTGATVAEMAEQGFELVGSHFPVFLHPVTRDEYALARRETKTGEGYMGFECEFDVDVTVESDLQRRDLTINSIAVDSETSELIDPFGGVADLENRVLRHTSEAFREDPVRVLRVARFRARFGPDWTVAPETAELISKMSSKGVLDELTPERVWKELSRALMEPFPRLFFDTLLECDALHAIFPEIYMLKTALESRRWHPEGDAYEHTMLVLTQSALYELDLDMRIACLCHDFGKGLTSRHRLPKHYGHDTNGVSVTEAFCNRLTIPTEIRNASMFATRYHMYMHKLGELNASTLVKMFDAMGARNHPHRVVVLYWVGVCDHRGRLGQEKADPSELTDLLVAWEKVQSVKFADVFPDGETDGNKIQMGLTRARVRALARK